jgi:uncharacterized tellurite resistance protein B-like protein
MGMSLNNLAELINKDSVGTDVVKNEEAKIKEELIKNKKLISLASIDCYKVGNHELGDKHNKMVSKIDGMLESNMQLSSVFIQDVNDYAKSITEDKDSSLKKDDLDLSVKLIKLSESIINIEKESSEIKTNMMKLSNINVEEFNINMEKLSKMIKNAEDLAGVK